MAKSRTERRRQRRVKVQVPIRLAYEKEEVSASTKNISLLGACADTEQEIAPGTRVGFLLELPLYEKDGSPSGYVRGQGAVVRCDSISEAQAPRRFELGIFFSYYITTKEENKLSQYIQHLISREAKEIRQWAKLYRARIEKRKREIAKKRRELARKKRARMRMRKKSQLKKRAK